MASAELHGARANAIMGVLWALAGLATVVMALRVKVWRASTGQASWAMVWAGAAWITGMVSQGMLTVSFAHGMGRHVADVPPGDLAVAIKWSWIGSSINLPGIGFGKWTAIAFVLALHGPTHVYSRRFLVFLAFTNMALDIALCFVIMFQCSPPSAIWDLSAQGQARCSSPDAQRYLGYVTAAWNAITDFVLVPYPPILLRHSQSMTARKKVLVCALMSFGVVSGASGIAKAYEIRNIESSHDQTWDTALLWVWTWTELWALIIFASIAPLAPLFRHWCGCLDAREPRAYLRASSGSRQGSRGGGGGRVVDARAWLAYSGRGFDSAKQRRSSFESLSDETRPESRSWYRPFGDTARSGDEGEEMHPMASPPRDGIAITTDVSVALEPVGDGDLEEGKSHCSAW